MTPDDVDRTEMPRVLWIERRTFSASIYRRRPGRNTRCKPRITGLSPGITEVHAQNALLLVRELNDVTDEVVLLRISDDLAFQLRMSAHRRPAYAPWIRFESCVNKSATGSVIPINQRLQKSFKVVPLPARLGHARQIAGEGHLRKQMRQRPKRRMKARGRPHRRQRL